MLFYIDRSFKDSLAGRKKVFEFSPLSFDEFLHFWRTADGNELVNAYPDFMLKCVSKVVGKEEMVEVIRL